MTVSSPVIGYDFPPLPYDQWEGTKQTLHLMMQIVGKIRLKYHPKLNHWWHVPLYPSAKGFTTGRIPYNGLDFELEFDFNRHVLEIRTCQDQHEAIPLPGLTIAAFYEQVKQTLARFGLPVRIVALPYDLPNTVPFAEDTQPREYDTDAAHRYWRITSQIADIFAEFQGHFVGKSTPVHQFWHSFDLALTRFSGRQAPPRTTGTRVDKEAYSHEVISFGFWPGDPNLREAAFYSYAYPMPDGITAEPLSPAIAYWGEYRGSTMALMKYADFIRQPNPREALLQCLESAYQAAALRADWPIESLARQDAV